MSPVAGGRPPGQHPPMWKFYNWKLGGTVEPQQRSERENTSTGIGKKTISNADAEIRDCVRSLGAGVRQIGWQHAEQLPFQYESLVAGRSKCEPAAGGMLPRSWRVDWRKKLSARSAAFACASRAPAWCLPSFRVISFRSTKPACMKFLREKLWCSRGTDDSLCIGLWIEKSRPTRTAPRKHV